MGEGQLVQGLQDFEVEIPLPTSFHIIEFYFLLQLSPVGSFLVNFLAVTIGIDDVHIVRIWGSSLGTDEVDRAQLIILGPEFIGIESPRALEFELLISSENDVALLVQGRGGVNMKQSLKSHRNSHDFPNIFDRTVTLAQPQDFPILKLANKWIFLTELHLHLLHLKW